MQSELCKTCAHKNVCMLDKNLVGDTFVMGHPCFFDNEKLYNEHLKREKEGFPCTEYLPVIVRCKDCKHFHYDMPYVIQGIPVLAHEVCDFWGDGCKTSETGFCSYVERETDE